MYCEQTYIICLSVYLSIYLSAVCIAIRTSDDNDGDDLLTSHDDSWCLKVSLFERIASSPPYLTPVLLQVCACAPGLWDRSRLCTWRLDEFRADTKYVSGAKQLRHTGWTKNGATDSWPQFCQFLTDLWKFFIGRFLGKFAVKQLSEIPPHLAYVATLPCETLCQQNKPLTTNYKVL